MFDEFNVVESVNENDLFETDNANIIRHVKENIDFMDSSLHLILKYIY